MRILLKFGADPNLPDEFSNIYLVAREKGLNSLQGIGHMSCYCCVENSLMAFMCLKVFSLSGL